MIVICFQKNILAGGLGDRINGLMSCYVISKLLKKPFYILWNKENIHKYIDYSKYYIVNIRSFFTKIIE